MSDASADKAFEFRRRLLRWFRTGRRSFSWRRRRGAYETLVAEMLLRKTDAAKVAAVYDGFLAAYPTPRRLALADEEQLREELRDLGIADRARLLRLTAEQICARHGGRVPGTLPDLMRLPGVGRYSANAVLCFARGQRAPLVDTNVIRVLERVFSISSPKPRPHEDLALWERAAELVPEEGAASYNRALLDFAAKVCTARSPRCEQCPLHTICDYGARVLPAGSIEHSKPMRSSRSAVRRASSSSSSGQV